MDNPDSAPSSACRKAPFARKSGALMCHTKVSLAAVSNVWTMSSQATNGNKRRLNLGSLVASINSVLALPAGMALRMNTAARLASLANRASATFIMRQRFLARETQKVRKHHPLGACRRPADGHLLVACNLLAACRRPVVCRRPVAWIHMEMRVKERRQVQGARLSVPGHNVHVPKLSMARLESIAVRLVQGAKLACGQCTLDLDCCQELLL